MNNLALTEADSTLPPGFPAPHAVHELRAPAGSASHGAFAALLLARLAGPVLWVGVAPCLYPPGLAWLGLDPARVLFAETRDDAETLGALEVGLRGGMAGVAETRDLSRLAARRLALAAKQGGGMGFLLRHAPRVTALDSTAPATRWLISPAPSRAAPKLRAELLYARGGLAGTFFFEIGDGHGAADALDLVPGTATRLVG